MAILIQPTKEHAAEKQTKLILVKLIDNLLVGVFTS